MESSTSSSLNSQNKNTASSTLGTKGVSKKVETIPNDIISEINEPFDLGNHLILLLPKNYSPFFYLSIFQSYKANFNCLS